MELSGLHFIKSVVLKSTAHTQKENVQHRYVDNGHVINVQLDEF